MTQPGVYDMPAEVYHADPVPGGSLSSSGARLLLPPSCPALFRHKMDHGQDPSREFEFGHAAHLMILGTGPEIRLIEARDYNTKAAQKARAQARQDGAIPLLTHEHQAVEAMAAALWDHPVAKHVFDRDKGSPERSLFWQDERTGVMLRARLDWLPHRSHQRMIVADYKTTRSADPASIEKAIADYGYHQQCAWYLDGVRALGLARDAAMVLVCQEKVPPYIVTVVEPDLEALRWGQALNAKAIDIYRQCMESGRWPGYSDEVVEARLPRWAEYTYELANAKGDYLLEGIA